MKITGETALVPDVFDMARGPCHRLGNGALRTRDFTPSRDRQGVGLRALRSRGFLGLRLGESGGLGKRRFRKTTWLGRC